MIPIVEEIQRIGYPKQRYQPKAPQKKQLSNMCDVCDKREVEIKVNDQSLCSSCVGSQSMLVKVAEKLAEHMIETAQKNWNDYVNDGSVWIDVDGELERAYESTFGGLALPEGMYDPLEASKTIKDAVQVMREVIQDEVNSYACDYRYHYGTPEQQLRERGMSVHDFL